MIETRAVEDRTPLGPPRLLPFYAPFQSPRERLVHYLTAPPASRTGEGGRVSGDRLRRRTTAAKEACSAPTWSVKVLYSLLFPPRHTWEIEQQ